MIQGNTSTTPLYYTKFPLSKYLEHLFGLSGGCTQAQDTCGINVTK